MPFVIRYQINLLQMAAYSITHTKSNPMVNASQFMRVARWKYNWLTCMSPITFLVLERLYQWSGDINITKTAALALGG